MWRCTSLSWTHCRMLTVIHVIVSTKFSKTVDFTFYMLTLEVYYPRLRISVYWHKTPCSMYWNIRNWLDKLFPILKLISRTTTLFVAMETDMVVESVYSFIVNWHLTPEVISFMKTWKLFGQRFQTHTHWHRLSTSETAELSGKFIGKFMVYFLQYFSFTSFSLCLNELRPGMLDTLAPTDSRLRPDVRIMEGGNIGRHVEV